MVVTEWDGSSIEITNASGITSIGYYNLILANIADIGRAPRKFIITDDSPPIADLDLMPSDL